MLLILNWVTFFIAPLDIAEPLLPGLLRWALEKSQTMIPSLLKPRALFLGTPFEPYRQDDVLTRISMSQRSHLL